VLSINGSYRTNKNGKKVFFHRICLSFVEVLSVNVL
jgi:hypothetical protein